MSQEKLLHLYRTPALSDYQKNVLLSKVNSSVDASVTGIETEYCFNIEAKGPLSQIEMGILKWLLSETFEPELFSESSFLEERLKTNKDTVLFEVGPRMNFSTAWSTNAVSICHSCGLTKVSRIERSRRYLLAGGAKRCSDKAAV